MDIEESREEITGDVNIVEWQWILRVQAIIVLFFIFVVSYWLMTTVVDMASKLRNLIRHRRERAKKLI